MLSGHFMLLIKIVIHQPWTHFPLTEMCFGADQFPPWCWPFSVLFQITSTCLTMKTFSWVASLVNSPFSRLPPCGLSLCEYWILQPVFELLFEFFSCTSSPLFSHPSHYLFFIPVLPVSLHFQKICSSFIFSTLLSDRVGLAATNCAEHKPPSAHMALRCQDACSLQLQLLCDPGGPVPHPDSSSCIRRGYNLSCAHHFCFRVLGEFLVMWPYLTGVCVGVGVAK